MRQNLWRCYRDGGREVKIPPKRKKKKIDQEDVKTDQPSGSKIHPGGITGAKTKTVTEYLEDQRKTKQNAEKRLATNWELLQTSLYFIEENEAWVVSSRMDRQYG